MTPEQIKLVRNSWQRVTPHTEAAAEAFYARLFDLDPHLRGMFKRDMKTQGRMLMSVIALAVSSLDDIATLLPAVRSLGRPASHGCVRLAPGNAATLYSLIANNRGGSRIVITR